MSPRRRALLFWVTVPLLLAMLAAAFFFKPSQFHPVVVIQVTEAIQLTFLQQGQATRSQCEATVNRVAQAIQNNCSTCRLVENRCIDKLDPRQRKLLFGQPVDVPVMRMPNGVIAFTAATPEIAWQVCQESERQTGRTVPGRAQCASPAFESLALSLAKISGKAGAGTIPTFQTLLAITLLAAAIAFLACYVIIRSERLHKRFSHDATETGPQKFHATPTARVGGLALACALAASILVIGWSGWLRESAVDGLSLLALAAIPAFAGGFGEDVTKRVGVLARLMLTAAAGVIASLLVGATLDRVDVPGIDMLLQWPIFAIAFTAFAVGGVANAINIIDGYHGLVGGYAILVLAALAFVSFQVGDPVVLSASLAMGGALLGFLVWNYPKGRIFMGDSGAYLLGFWLAELSVLLVARNPDVSPWFPMALLAYPVFETFFSIYRRKFLRGTSPGRADAMHLHQLIYRRVVRVAIGSHNRQDITRRNSKVATYIWAGTVLFILPSLLFWRSTPALIAIALVSCSGYLWLYLRLIRWRAPAWMVGLAKSQRITRAPR